MKLNRYLLYLLLAVLACPVTSFAIDEVTNLDQVVVTASRIEELKADQTMNITVLSEEQIKESSAKDLRDLLSTQGFKVREYPNSLSAVQIRGFATDTHGQVVSSYVTILINGRRINTSNLATILMDNVERVEIIRGPGSVQYGSSAIGGVVNVITKKGDTKPSFFIDQTVGSWNYRKTAAGVSGLVKNFDYSLSASRAAQSSYNTGGGDKYDNTGFDSKDRLSANLGYTFLTNQRVGVTYTSYVSDDIGSPDQLTTPDPEATVGNANRQYDVVYDGQTADDFLLWSLRYFSGIEEYENFDAGVRSYFRDTEQQGANAQLTAKWDMVQLTAGVDWINYAISTSNMDPGKENTYDNPALFSMAKVKLLDDKLILSAGGRYDSFDIEGDTGDSTDATNLSKNFGAAYKISPMVKIRANYAEGFKMPTPSQLFMYTDYSAWGYGIWSGNPDLDPEKSATYEVGVDVVKNSFNASLTYFHTDFENSIGYSYNAADGVTYYENTGEATVSGYEGSLQFDIGALMGWSSELIPYVSFTYLDTYENEETGEDRTYTSALTASYGLTFRNQESGLTANLNFTHTGEQDINSSETLDSVTLTDFSVSKKLYDFEKYGDVTLKADIRNLTDEDYAYNAGYPMPGRSFYLSLKYRY